MSNSKVRKQLEERNKNAKLLEAYKKKSDLTLNYQMCKAYFKDSALSISGIVTKILREKYNLPWQEKIIRKALAAASGTKNLGVNTILTIPQFKYEEKVYDILAKFVERNITKMANDFSRNGLYPLAFRDLMEKYS